MSNGLRVIYAGTPDFAVPALAALIESGHEVVAVYTQPDRPAGRGRKLQPSPVKQVALDASIPVEQPVNFREEADRQTLADYNADVMVVAAYGLILPQVVLDTPKYGCLNIHGSLLPRWRGAAPIHRAIQTGDKETGVTIMQMAAGLDTGDMLLKTYYTIGAEDTGATVHDALAADGASALMTVLEQVETGTLAPEVQDESLTCYASKLTKAEAEIDWSQSAVEIDRRIRAFNPWPVAYTKQNGQAMRLLMSSVVEGEKTSAEAGTVLAENKQGIQIACGEGVISISRLQLPGKKAMSVSEFLNGRSLSGEKFPS
ncbi:methionyl-tRNA formyltransferase [Leucothrix arctica]|uniref:Methionyl-tRNA formyltransferase n=1 Tax=Leucothrix arctica TaxID=1481894 RepID=A0A317CJU8_9GAMM|nr:methionyl-tRNA formyltransferase [Leucothrix arctica]PWQ98766.1 methionyl-tRNA formyltransferase [Leucothrix arctica]